MVVWQPEWSMIVGMIVAGIVTIALNTWWTARKKKKEVEQKRHEEAEQ